MTLSLATSAGALVRVYAHIPDGFIAFIARFAIAATFWKSGQTKITGLAIDIVDGRFEFGWPRLADATIDLFRDEYRLPFLAPELAAIMASVAEHVFPALLLVGLATRLSATALLIMTLTIQIFVYPSAYAVHGVWAVALLFLMAKGAGPLSLDRLLGRERLALASGEIRRGSEAL